MKHHAASFPWLCAMSKCFESSKGMIKTKSAKAAGSSMQHLTAILVVVELPEHALHNLGVLHLSVKSFEVLVGLLAPVDHAFIASYDDTFVSMRNAYYLVLRLAQREHTLPKHTGLMP